MGLHFVFRSLSWALIGCLFGFGAGFAQVDGGGHSPVDQQRGTAEGVEELVDLARRGRLTVRALRGWGFLPQRFVNLGLELRKSGIDLLDADIGRVRELIRQAGSDRPGPLLGHAAELKALEGHMAAFTTADAARLVLAADGADTPFSALQRFAAAQSRGDVDAMMAEIATGLMADEAAKRIDCHIRKLSPLLRLGEVRLEPVAQGIGEQGRLAVVRYSYAVHVEAGGKVTPQVGGSLALMAAVDQKWKVYGIWPDEFLTLKAMGLEDSPDARRTQLQPEFVLQPLVATYDASAARLPLAQRQPGRYAAALDAVPVSAPASGARLVSLAEINETINRTVRTWRVDEGQVLRDSMGSAAGALPVVGDFKSNLYTAHEMGKTLLNLPETVRQKYFGAAMADIAVISWGIIQMVAEPFPALDHAADAVGTSLGQFRYNQFQLDNFYRIRRRLLLQEFQDLSCYIIVAPTPDMIVLSQKNQSGAGSMIYSTYRDWPTRFKPIENLAFINDEWHREGGVMDFRIGAIWSVKKSESEDMFAAFLSLGAVKESAKSFDDEIAHLPLDLTHLVEADGSTGDVVLEGFQVVWSDGGHPFVRYRTTCNRGMQTLRLALRGAMRSHPMRVENRVFNAIEDIKLQLPDGKLVNRLQLLAGETIEGLRLTPVMVPGADSRVIPLKVVEHPCLKMTEIESGEDPVVADRWSALGGDATFSIQGLRPGNAAIVLELPGGGVTPPLRSRIDFVVEDAVFVPDVTGIPEIGKAPNSATWRLAQAGLGAEASRERNETVAEGVVIRQDPAPKTLVPVGSKVRLTVSAPRKEAPPPETEAKKPPSPVIKRKDTIFMGDSLTYEIGGGTLTSYRTTPNGYKPEFRGTVKPGETVSLTLAGTSLARREFAQPGKHDGTLRVSLKATGGGTSPIVDSVQKKVAPEATETCSISFTVPEDARTVTLTGYFYNYNVGKGFTMGWSAEVKITFRVLGGP